MGEGDHKLKIRDLLQVEVLRREFPDATDFYDRNWLVVGLSAKDEVSRVNIQGPYLLTSELRSLLNGMRDLMSGNSSGFDTQHIEPMLELSIKKQDDLGHFDARLVLRSEWAPRPDLAHSTHQFEFGIDQSDLQLLERQLDNILCAYPVVDRP